MCHRYETPASGAPKPCFENRRGTRTQEIEGLYPQWHVFCWEIRSGPRDKHISALFSTSLPSVSTFVGTGPTFQRIALETVTMVRYDMSMVVTDQKRDEQFFHEGSHV